MRKFWLCLVIPALLACGSEKEWQQVNLQGYAQGTTFQIKYLDSAGTEYLSEVEQIFRDIDASLSTYDTTSLISRLNRGEKITMDPYFDKVLKRSLAVAKESKGAFDPSVGPLLDVWSFGKAERPLPDSSQVDSVMNYTGFRRISPRGKQLQIPPGFRLSFDAIAQGYTVDVIAAMLESKEIENFMVEVGGEVRCKGRNMEGEYWRLGIDRPSEEMDQENRIQAIVGLNNVAMATSGNYRKFWVDDSTGMKYSHTIDPISGYPARNRLLSATIIASSCMIADAYATVCMVKGLNASISFVETKPDIEAYFIYTNEDGDWEVYMTQGFREILL